MEKFATRMKHVPALLALLLAVLLGAPAAAEPPRPFVAPAEYSLADGGDAPAFFAPLQPHGSERTLAGGDADDPNGDDSPFLSRNAPADGRRRTLRHEPRAGGSARRLYRHAYEARAPPQA